MRPLLLALLAFQAPAQEPQETPREFFAARVRPLLEARCFKCHGGEKAKGGLRLDSREALLKGGDQGPAVAPGDAAKSLLLRAVSYADPDLQMPPKEKLPAGEIEILVRWIKSGAPWSDAPRPAKKEKEITAGDRAWWAFQPVRDPAPPALKDATGWCRNDVDRFILDRLRAEGLDPAPEADRPTLIRRLTFDLHGLPPSPEEVESFAGDPSPDAYRKLVERLLASPRYGERMARRWLDLVRYSESDGHRQDAYRPHAWRYRDYVVRAFNEDKPYDRFVAEQLAGDELAPDDPAVTVATGFLRLGMYEFNQRNVFAQWSDILNDVTDVAGDVFLGLGMGCARCHDHKFDPILQSDYYRLQAFFSPILWRDDLPLATPEEARAHAAALRTWEEKTAAVRAEIAALEQPYLDSAAKGAVEKFIPEIQEMIRKAPAERAPYERQIAELAWRQVLYDQSQIDGKIKGKDRERWSELRRRLGEFDAELPRPLPPAFVVTDAGPAAPPTLVPGPGRRDVAPGPIAVLDRLPVSITPTAASTGRRSALARWIARADHPLTARVRVNRLWQHHFGRGLVATSSDFGKLGEKPSHPDLLDWLASRFVEGGWSAKNLDRLILNSAAYRQSSAHPGAARARLRDPENRLLWRMSPRRLEAEEIRDAMLAASGEIDLAPGGAPADSSGPRRTVYTKAIRNTRDALLEAFDAPDAFSSAPGRNVTTTAPQALLLINGAWPLQRAGAFAERLRRAPAEGRIDLAWRLAFGRPPRSDEREAATGFLAGASGAAADLSADPLLTQPTPHRGGQSVRIRGANVEDRLRLADAPLLPSADFTVEAMVVLESLHEDAQVRVIASQWAGKVDQPGWSLGVTGQKSKHEPRNLILQLVGDAGYEVVPSDLRVDLHKLHYVAVSVRIRETGEGGATFLLKDLSDPDAPVRAASVPHRVTGRYRSKAALVVGGRDGPAGHGWDGLIDEVRISDAALSREELLLHDGAPASVVAHWKFEPAPGILADSAGRQRPLARTAPRAEAGRADAAWIDLCHVLLNSNEFLHVD
jgi:hypothetical protein